MGVWWATSPLTTPPQSLLCLRSRVISGVRLSSNEINGLTHQGKSVCIVEDELSYRGLALALDTFPICGKGKPPHEQRLPKGLFEDDLLSLEDEGLPGVAIACDARLRDQAGDVVVGIVEQVARPWAKKDG